MERFLASCTLGAAALVAIATPAVAAPAEHIVDSGCLDDAEVPFCYSIDYRVKGTLTPSGNEIIYSAGTFTYDATFDDGARVDESFDFDLKSVARRHGQAQVDRRQTVLTYYLGESLCTDVIHYKISNGKLQVNTYETTCT